MIDREGRGAVDRWPALMKRETAAAYCDMTPEQFDRQCPIAPVDQGWRGLRWKRSRLDQWIENLPEKPRRSGAEIDAANDRPTDAGQALASPEARRRAALDRL